ncbi:hypothetical protein [Streptomyces sp. NBC_00102]|uniref:hypothetical protein n=1 Tax=Streptomyces sp. NBC_00102 TaxID=2975652 RepID=UPI0022591336|nr:hypothetical protein [Streptomyces sp. NBC_00102]MCX5396831.1 hypothetical protein [Streptomyces sp. NBC_00102]
MKKWVRPLAGAVLLVVGVIWSLQGSGAIDNSKVMSGESQWLLIGLVVAVVGLTLLVGGLRKLRAGRR